MKSHTLSLRIMLMPLALLASLLCTPALAVYKCEAGGAVTYGDTPCPNGTQIKPADPVPKADAARAAERAKKQRSELDRLDAEHRKEALQNQQQQNRLLRADAAKAKKCTQLAMRKKAAADAVINASKSAAPQARRKARLSAEKYEVDCNEQSTGSLQKFS